MLDPAITFMLPEYTSSGWGLQYGIMLEMA